MPTLIATRQLYGDWGNVDADQSFETDEETALSLESRGLAVRWRPPNIEHMKPPHPNKMLIPPENKSA